MLMIIVNHCQDFIHKPVLPYWYFYTSYQSWEGIYYWSIWTTPHAMQWNKVCVYIFWTVLRVSPILRRRFVSCFSSSHLPWSWCWCSLIWVNVRYFITLVNMIIHSLRPGVKVWVTFMIVKFKIINVCCIVADDHDSDGDDNDVVDDHVGDVGE